MNGTKPLYNRFLLIDIKGEFHFMSEPTIEKKSSDILSVSVPPEMKSWLDKHTKVNRSKLFQDAVNSLRYPQPHKISPAIMMMCFMGIVGGIAISMMAGLIFQIINQIFAIGLLFLGMALSMGSFLTIWRARRDTKILRQGDVAARI